MRVQLADIFCSVEQLGSVDHNSAAVNDVLKSLSDSVCGFGESFVDVGVDAIPTLKEAQAKKSDMDKMADEMFLRPHVLLKIYSK